MWLDYSCADRDGLCDNLRGVTWEDIFKLGASIPASEFCEFSLEMVHISLIVNSRCSIYHLSAGGGQPSVPNFEKGGSEKK